MNMKLSKKRGISKESIPAGLYVLFVSVYVVLVVLETTRPAASTVVAPKENQSEITCTDENYMQARRGSSFLNDSVLPMIF
jgi:hypothetical protein